MSYALDVNVLVNASSRVSGSHGKCAAFLEKCANGSEILCLTWPTLIGYLRIVTDHRILSVPLSPEDAQNAVETLLNLKNVRVLTEEKGFWDIYKDVAGQVVARGKLVPDVYFAALLKQHEVRILYTYDKDFRAFDFLKVTEP